MIFQSGVWLSLNVVKMRLFNKFSNPVFIAIFYIIKGLRRSNTRSAGDFALVSIHSLFGKCNVFKNKFNMITKSKTVPGNILEIFIRKHDGFVSFVENNLDGVRFLNNTPFGFGTDDCLVAIDDVDIRSKSKDEIIKLFKKEILYDYNDIFKLTVVRKSHPDQSSIIAGNVQVLFGCLLCGIFS